MITELNQTKLAMEYAPRVLIVDDDRDIAEAIQYIAMINNPQAQCTIATDPYEALLNLADHPYDLVLVDQRIPGLQGSSILKKIDQFVDEDPLIVDSGIYKNNKVPVVMMSGSEDLSGLRFELNNFMVNKLIQKKELPVFLSNYFAKKESDDSH